MDIIILEYLFDDTISIFAIIPILNALYLAINARFMIDALFFWLNLLSLFFPATYVQEIDRIVGLYKISTSNFNRR